MDVTTRSCKILPELHPVLPSEVDGVKLEYDVNNAILAEFVKIGDLKEKSAEVEQPSKLKSAINGGHRKGKEVEASLTRIPWPPYPFPYRLKKKADDGKLSKFMAMLK